MSRSTRIHYRPDPRSIRQETRVGAFSEARGQKALSMIMNARSMLMGMRGDCRPETDHLEILNDMITDLEEIKVELATILREDRNHGLGGMRERGEIRCGAPLDRKANGAR